MTQREIAEIRAKMHEQNWRKDGSLKTEHVRLYGLNGTWCMIASHFTMDGVYYLWESEQRGDERPAVLTNERLMVIDSECESGIRTALRDHGIVD